jgi:hypothetical protein
MSVILVLSARAAKIVKASLGDLEINFPNDLFEPLDSGDVEAIAQSIDREIDCQLLRPHSQGVIGDPEADIVELASGAAKILG